VSDKTAIEWSDATWNFLVGCTKVSAGCTNCYAIRSVARMSGNPQFGERYQGLVTVGQKPLNWTGKVAYIPEKLRLPLEWKQPRRVFVNSLSDLFHPDVPDDTIDDAFGVMALARQHTFQVLTKRPERMRAYFAERFQVWNDRHKIVWHDRSDRVFEAMQHFTDPKNDDHFDQGGNFIWPGWPLPNVWLGTSVEDQRAADERIPHLLSVPAAVRFLSCEPLLGPIELSDVTRRSDAVERLGKPALGGIDWIITGGESGPKARPMDPAWASSLQAQCAAAGGVAFFHKQNGGRTAKANGRLLDGREWNEYPTVATAGTS
jgi:protein gp37